MTTRFLESKEDRKMSPTEVATILIGVTHGRSLGFHTDLAKKLKEAGCHIHLVSDSGPDLQNLSNSFDIHPVKMLREPNLRRDFQSFTKWLVLLYRIRPDVLLVGTPKASLLGILAATITRVPIRIYFVHGLRFESARGKRRSILIFFEKLTSLFATTIIAVSPSVRTKMINMGISKDSKTVVIGSGSANGLKLEKFEPVGSHAEKQKYKLNVGLDPSLPVIGFVGRLTTEKGIAELRDALISLHKKRYKFQVLLVGRPEDEVGASVHQELKLAGIHILSTGHVDETAAYFKSMDIMCLPTYREGLGNVVLEALASGVPVISTQVTGIVDLIQHEETGLLVPPRSSNALLTALEKLLDDSRLRAILRENGISFVRKNFDTEEVVRRQVNYILAQVEKLKS